MELYRNVAEQTVKFAVPTLATYTVKVYSSGYPEGEEVVNDPVPGENYINVTIPYKHTKYDGKVVLIASFTLSPDSETHTISREYPVVTPLFTADEFTDADLTSLNITAADLVELERFIRHIIEAYTGQSFGMTLQTHNLNGNTRSIDFNVPLIMFTGTSSRYATGSMTTTDSVPYEVIDDGFGVRFDWKNYHVKSDTFFLTNPMSRACFTMTGKFGYNSVPQDVKEAARVLIGLFNCEQTLWRDRYIENLRNADGSTIKYNEGTYWGTGSVTADQLLAKYVRDGSSAAVI